MGLGGLMSERSLTIDAPMSRAAPLPAAERRSAIMAATERLLVERGQAVSTREIAEAAGIAEGTIFRVFPTKEAIIDAIFEDAFNHDARRAALSKVDMAGDLETRMTAAVRIMQRRIRRIQALFAAVGYRPPAGPGQKKKESDFGHSELAAILEPDAGRLRVPPIEAARLLLGVVMALTSPIFAGRSDVDPEEIVNLVLNGIASTSDRPPAPKDAPC